MELLAHFKMPVIGHLQYRPSEEWGCKSLNVKFANSLPAHHSGKVPYLPGYRDGAASEMRPPPPLHYQICVEADLVERVAVSDLSRHCNRGSALSTTFSSFIMGLCSERVANRACGATGFTVPSARLALECVVAKLKSWSRT